MAQAVSSRYVTTEAKVLARVSPYGIYGGQSGTPWLLTLSEMNKQ
jgi:hypothetical protein